MSETDLKQLEETEPGEAGAAPRRRRRSEKYEEEARDAERPEPRGFVSGGESETAREVARRFRMEEAENTTRMPTAREGLDAGGGHPEEQIRFARGGERRDAADRYGREDAYAGRNQVRGGSSRAAMNGSWSPVRDSREHVGYAPGRMGISPADRGRMSEESRARLADPRYVRQTLPPEPEKPRGRKALTALVVFLLLIGAALIGLLMIPEDAEGPLGKARAAVAGLLKRDRTEEPTVTGFLVSSQENALAPAEISFSIATRGGAEDVRMVDGEGSVLPTVRTVAQSENGTLWNLTWRAETAFRGEVRLQLLTGDAWQDTDRTVALEILDPPAESPAPENTEIPVVFTTEEGGEPETAGNAGTDGETEITEDVELPEDGGPEQAGEDPDEIPEGEPDEISEEEDGQELTAEAGDPEKETEQTENVGEPEDEAELTAEAGEPEDEAELTAEAAEPEDAQEQSAEAGEPEDGAELTAQAGAEADVPDPAEDGGETKQAAASERPKLTVNAGKEADPSLISTVQIFNGTKKVREYARADREKVQMPTAGEYTRKQTGIFTYRGDAFRQNAAVGTVKGADSLEVIWTAEAGSVKGAGGTTYYGVGWTGQPAIVKWGKQVRESSDMYESKKEKSGLREVIVGGLDGYIYFLDLVDGAKTRNSIRLGYPMKGSPSVAPGGAPYMNVGQFARKMARGQGTIGLRQYNLYNNKELPLIDGLDAKNNRALNKIGSFETSALISRVSNVMVTAGTNGLLYVVNLNPDFDFVAGIYQQSPTFVMLRSKAKNETDAQTAVEASVAMYDHYVYYADMGGYLRCVDTNSMTVCWARALGDAVESTPALDWHGEKGLDLYCATELSIRKSGDAEIHCVDALTGEDRWSLGISVRKDKKNKNAVCGFRASPVIGQKGLSEYVYYTVNRLSDTGREQLGLGGGEDAAVIALRKSDGGVAWVYGLSGSGYSSPVAVYDAEGRGSIIQCAGDGSITLLDGLSGQEKNVLKIDGTIEASPAVYNSIMVIATTERNKNNIYGIRIQ